MTWRPRLPGRAGPSGRPLDSAAGSPPPGAASPTGSAPVVLDDRPVVMEGLPDGPRRPGPPSRGTVAAFLAVFAGLLLGAAGTLVHLPYAIMMPGPASNVLGQETRTDGQKVDLIAISGQRTYPTTGALDFTTVRVNGGPGYPVNVWDVLGAWVDPTQDVYPVDALFPPQQSAQDVEAENTAEMVDSQQEAAAVALRKLGYSVPERIKIAQVSKTAPSGELLKPGDVLTSVGGVAVTTADSVRQAIQKVSPGQPVQVVVQRGGAAVTLDAVTGSASDGRTVLGVVLGVDFTFPFTVKIDVGSVGGPSAGLMFSLGIYDKLTDGALTGGRTIAGTGTIDAAGNVGPIGGIQQKMAGAQRSGASYFLAPAGNCDEVRGNIPSGLTVVKVATFDDAEQAVTRIGTGDASALPAC